MKNAQTVKQLIINDSVLNSVADILDKYNVWLVGGYIRDLFLGIDSDDRDLVCIGYARDLALDIADKTGGTFVELDNENEIYRVVLGDKKTFFDISRAMNDDMFSDAKRRDFTINSIYFDIYGKEFFDLYNGVGDINSGVLKTAAIKNFKDDPLRMIRAFRFMALTGFKIQNEILDFIKENKKLIGGPSAERINCEILKLFGGDYACESLIEADKCGLLNEIFPFVEEIKKIPKNSHHHLDLFHHSIETMRSVRTKNPLLRLAAFLHDIGKPATHTIEPSGRHRFIGHDDLGSKLVRPMLSDLKFSKKQIDYVSLMIKNHIYPSSLMSSGEVQDKAKIRFIRKLDPYVEDIIELARADRLSARGPAVDEDMVNNNLLNLEELLQFYKEIKPKLEKLPKLLDGKEIMELLNIKPSPHLGEVVDALKEAQLEGKVCNREDAVEFVKSCKIVL